MECKDPKLTGGREIKRSINRNIVECKGLYAMRASESRHSINRNIVECKEE